MAKLKSILRAVTGVDLAAMDVEIARMEGELKKLQVTREALGKLQGLLGTGANGEADPTIAAGTTLERIRAFLAGGKEETTAAIAAAVGMERGAVYQAMRKHPEEFRQRDNLWRLK